MPIHHQSRAAKRLKHSVEFKYIVRVMQPSYSTEPATDSSHRSLPSSRTRPIARHRQPTRRQCTTRHNRAPLICGSRPISTERHEARIKGGRRSLPFFVEPPRANAHRRGGSDELRQDDATHVVDGDAGKRCREPLAIVTAGFANDARADAPRLKDGSRPRRPVTDPRRAC